LLHYIITITLAIVTTFMGVVTFYALRRINNYENIDDKGTFESDDEVGFFFTEIKQLGNELNNLFETEVEDATIKEKKTKEK